ncbi:MAG TPA: LuxR C-terminal-related transcriptional regulator [Solirubrobacterales bacterium]|nr:LuxR C-terminal-related transcriptional regulator [Solirubrobacterales bacterium]
MVGGGPLIGREAEFAELEELLAEAGLLTIAGAGGCGKTRLALELEDRIAGEDGAAGHAVAMLASVAGEDQLLDALLRAFGAREQFGYSPRQVLLECAASWPSPLLVLDNCEHQLAAAAGIVAELLAAAPEMRILATSRAPLGVAGERVFNLRPLGLPEAGGGIAALVGSDAGRLFVDRAARADPAFELTPGSAAAAAELCRALDGLPLALCLAAARLGQISVEEIAGELARPGLSGAAGEAELSRHDSLDASLAWSYRLLDARERQLLRCLSLFADGFTTEAAQSVGAPELSTEAARILLDSLEAKGLIATVGADAGGRRWTLFETVSEYAVRQLALEREEDEAADRHLAWFAAYAARADEMLAQADGHRLIDAETANLRRALERATLRDPAAAPRIAASLMRHWVLGEHFQEGRSACAEALSASASTDGEAGSRAVLHGGASVFALLAEDYAGALGSVQQAVGLLPGITDADAEAACLLLCSTVLIQTGADLTEGFRFAERAVELERSSGRPLPLAYALANLSISAGLCERFDLASAAYEEFLAIRPACDHPRLRTWAEQAAAWTDVSVGSPRRALEHADRALALEGSGPTMTHFQALGFRIQALARLGETERASQEGAEAMKRAEESGALVAAPAIDVALMVADLQSANLDGAQERARRLLEMPHLHTLALARETLTRAALARGDLAQAQSECRELEAIAERSGSARQAATAQRLMGSAAVRAGETKRGRDLLHDALRTCAELGLERDAAETLEELALAEARSGALERPARLAGAAAATWARLECAPSPITRDDLNAIAAQLDGDAGSWRAAWEQGQGLTLEEATAYARRGRGPRDRPPVGWESLTPVELQVAELASEGMSNPQIAAQLFVSRSTVKLHLSNVYRKLGVRNRVELARIAQHG